MAACARGETFTMAWSHMQRDAACVGIFNSAAHSFPKEGLLRRDAETSTRDARYSKTANPRASGTTQAHAVNQSPPMVPAQPNYAEQPTRDRRGLRNDRAIYLDVIDRVLEILAT